MRKIVETYPKLLMWLILAVFSSAILVYEARDVGLTTSQYFWLIVSTTLVMGLCVWIVGWGEDDDLDSAENDAA